MSDKRLLNVVGPDLWSGPVSRRSAIKGASLMAALFGAPGLLAACGGGDDTASDTTAAGDTAPAVTPEAEKILNFFNWTAYIDDTSNAPDVPPGDLTLPKFETETGIKVNYSTYSSNQELVAKIQAGGSGYDIVVPTDYVVARLIQAGRLRKLDKSRLPNVTENIADKYNDLFYDPGLQYSVPWGHGNTGIGVNPEVVTETVTDAAIFGNDAYAGKMSLLDEPRSTIPLALFYLGLSPTTGNEADLDKAFEQLTAWKANATITSDYQDPLGAGDLVVAHAYSGDVYQQIVASGTNLQYVIPTQGGDQYVDSMVILSDAPHPGNAHEFINFVYQPEVSANLMTAITYRNANETAWGLLSPELRSNPVVFPPPEVEERLSFINLDEDTELIWRDKWDAFLAGES